MFIDPIAHYAHRHPQAIAVYLRRTELSYFELNLQINALAESFGQASRLEAGWRSSSTTAAALAVGAGAPPPPVRFPSPRPCQAGILTEVVRPDAIVAEKRLPTMRGVVIEVSAAWLKDAVNRGRAAGCRKMPAMNSPARIILSSGTTGRPKSGPVHPCRPYLAGAGEDSSATPAAPIAGPLCLMGVDTLAGYTSVMRTWFFGGAVCLIPALPVRSLRAASRRLLPRRSRSRR